MIQLYHLL